MGKYGRLAFCALVLMLMPELAFAQDGDDGLARLGIAIGAGLAVGLAGLGCGIGQGMAAGNTTAAVARNPEAFGKMFVAFILAMAFIESISIYGLVIAIQLIGT